MSVISTFTSQSWEASNEGMALRTPTSASRPSSALPTQIWKHITTFLKHTTTLVAGGRNGCIYFTNFHQSIKAIYKPLSWAAGGIWSLAYDGKSSLAVGYYNGTIIKVNISQAAPIIVAKFTISKDNTPLLMKYAKEGEILIVGTYRGDILILNKYLTTTRTLLGAFINHQGNQEAWCIQEIISEERIAIGTQAGDIITLNINNFTTKIVFSCDQDRGVTCMDTNTDKSRLAVGTSEALIYILDINEPPQWEIITSTVLPDLTEIWAIRFTNKDKILVVGSKLPDISFILLLDFLDTMNEGQDIRSASISMSIPLPGYSIQLGISSTITSIHQITESEEIFLTANDGGFYKMDLRNYDLPAMSIRSEPVTPQARQDMRVYRPSPNLIHQRSKDFSHFDEIWCSITVTK